MEAKQATLHHELIAQLLDSRIPKTEREHAAAREIERLRADILQELIDAPEPEPVGYTNETELDYVRKYEALPVSGTFWPTSDEDACVALYTAPPANNQSEQQLEMVNAPAPSVPDGWRPFLTDVITAAGLLEHGKRDKGLAGRIGKFAFDAMRAAPTPAEPPTDLPTWENGDDPLVSGGLISRGVVDFATVGIWPTKPAPSVPDGWRSAIAKEFPLYDEDKIDEDKHCCEWVMLQERKRPHKMLEAAPQPPKLSDERILEIWASNSGRPVTMGKARIIAQARAIEREILGES